MATSKRFHIIQKTFGSGLNLSIRAGMWLAFVFMMGLPAGAATLKNRKSQDFQSLSNIVNQEAFWHKKSVWQALEKERKVAVSVTHRDLWSFKGAGLVQAPRPYCVEKAKDFNRLMQSPEYFSAVHFDEATSILHLRVHFLGRERPLDLELFEENLASESRLYFRSLGPWLSGLEGVFLLKDQERQQSEVAVLAQYAGGMGWVPDWILSFAFEAVMHHVAEQLRNTVESDYKLYGEK